MDKLLKSQDYLSNSGVDIEKPKEDKASIYNIIKLAFL